MKTNDRDDNVIDFSRMKDKKKAVRQSRKKLMLALIAAAAVLVLAVCALLFFQLREATSDDGFWQNFQSSQHE